VVEGLELEAVTEVAEVLTVVEAPVVVMLVTDVTGEV
jgi:hypothetical protein